MITFFQSSTKIWIITTDGMKNILSPAVFQNRHDPAPPVMNLKQKKLT